MYECKPISPDSIEGALAKAERYRLLNEPGEAESICQDILEIEPNHQQAIISLVLCLTDQIAADHRAFEHALSAASRLSSQYDRAYYAGIAWERRAKARHQSGGLGAGGYAHAWIVKALDLFRTAEQLRPQGNADAILRWNACVRFLRRHPEITPRVEDKPEPILSE